MKRGEGRVFQPIKKGKQLDTWWLELYVAGRKRRLTGFSTKAAALDALKEERKRRGRGDYVAPETDRLRVEDLLMSYLDDLRKRGKKAVSSAKKRADLVSRDLGHFRAVDLNVGHLEDYRRRRAKDGAGEVTLDRDLQLLRAAFRLAVRHERISRVPHFPISGRDNVRTGFFEPAEAEAVEKQLPGVAAQVFHFARYSGWRISEILGLRWESIDRAAREARLPTTKNGRSRSLYLFGELWKVIEARWGARAFGTATGTALSVYVFHGRRGQRILYGTFRKAYLGACLRAKVAGRWIHDLRRSTARELRRAGVPESVCMSVTGHLTSEIFRRYAIVDSHDQADALKAREALLAAEQGNYGATVIGRLNSEER
jgi:integrase